MQDFTQEESQRFNSEFYIVGDEGDSEMQTVEFNNFSEENWLISDPQILQLQSDFGSNQYKQVTVEANWSFEREGPIGAEVSKFK